jgi:nucleobase:cation symporter-1, NCS1 family
LSAYLCKSAPSSYGDPTDNCSTDYFVVRKGNIWHRDLFDPKKGTAYHYHGGFNWCTLIAFTVTVAILVPGFAGTFPANAGIAVGWKHIYSLGWVLGCTISSVAYWALAVGIGGGRFCKEEREMGFEESYETQRMFQEDTSSGGSGVEVAEADKAGTVQQVVSATDDVEKAR